MFRLTTVFTIWQGENRGMAPLLRVNCYGHWWENPGWELESTPLGVPIATGFYYRTDILAQVEKINGWVQVQNAIASLPKSFWQTSTTLNLYQTDSLPTNSTVVITLRSPVAVASEMRHRGYNYAIAVPGISVTSISSSGLIFTPGDDVGTFSQDGDAVTIHGDAAYSLELGQELVVTGEMELSFSEPYCQIASFYLPDVLYCDRIDWVGHSFSPARDANSPQIWEFTWNSDTHTANLFLKSTSMPYFPAYQKTVVSRSSGTINFNR